MLKLPVSRFVSVICIDIISCRLADTYRKEISALFFPLFCYRYIFDILLLAR